MIAPNFAVNLEMAGRIGILEPPEGLLQALTSWAGDKRMTQMIDLPAVILSSILARLSDPVDIASVVCSCRLFRGVSKSVPFRIRACSSKLDEGVGVGGCDEAHNRYSLTALGAWTRKALAAVRSQMPATRVLDLSGCWIGDEDVAAVLADLRCLECLILDGCQKLSSAVADALAVSVRSGPQALSLQRCFGLGPAAAGNLLAAAAADGSRLQCILLSHLDRLDLPRDPPLLEVQEECIEKPLDGKIGSPKIFSSASVGAGIRVLALHNCGSLGLPELAAVGMTCPMLEFLLLGGSVEGLGLCLSENLPQEKVVAAVSALVKTAECFIGLRVLEITFFTFLVTQGVRDQIGKSVEVWDFSDRNSVAVAAAVLAGYKLPVCRLSNNTCQERAHGLAHHIVTEKDDTTFSDRGRRVGLNICNEQNSLSRHLHGSGLEGFGTDKISKLSNMEKRREYVENVLLAVRAAANCSDWRRRTPLHVAAACGDAGMVKGLLSIGAMASGMKDSAGATALFVASECGHAKVCEQLLNCGADVLCRNRAGENPLYIAALRGHPAVVEVMLSHCCANSVNWQSAHVYGDGWTPLMAAAVADHQDVAEVILQTAWADVSLDSNRKQSWDIIMDGSSVGKHSVANSSQYSVSGNTLVFMDNHEYPEVCVRDDGRGSVAANIHQLLRGKPPQILDAQNRYGQTALHIAARRASIWFVTNLLHAGASVDIYDAYGRRALDEANRQRHTVVANILKEWEQSQHDGLGHQSEKKSSFSALKNVALSSKHSHQGDASRSGQEHMSRNRGCGTSNATSCQSTRRSETTKENASGGSRHIWRAKGSHHQAYPDTNTGAPSD